MKEIVLTPESWDLLADIVEDLPNWGDLTPTYNHITGKDSPRKGSLTDLKRKGLVTTFNHDGDQWIKLTPEGKDFVVRNTVTRRSR